MRTRVTIRFRLLALVAAFAFLAATAAGPAEAATKKKRTVRKKPAAIPMVPRPHDPFEVSFTSSDGVRLVASWFRQHPEELENPVMSLPIYFPVTE